MDLQFPIDDYNLDEFVAVAADFGQTDYGFVVTPNVDHLIRYHEDPDFRAQYASASYVLLDSRFLSNVFRISKGLKIKVCPGSDLTASLFDRVIRPDDRIVLIGCSEEQAHKLATHYGLTQLKHHNPPMGFIRDARAVEECLQFVEAQSPFRYCFLAVGAPQQEIVARKLKARGVARGMALCVGASVNFITGTERRAPLWVQRLALEWLFRLACSPGRLAKRYLVRGPRVFSLLRFTKVMIRTPDRKSGPFTEMIGAADTPESI